MVKLDHKPALLYLPPCEGIAFLFARKPLDPNKNGLLWLTEAAFSNQLEIKEKTNPDVQDSIKGKKCLCERSVYF